MLMFGIYAISKDMAREKAIAEKKKRGRPSTGIGAAIGLRLYPEDERALRAWIAAQPAPRPSVPDAIRRLLRERLAAQ